MADLLDRIASKGTETPQATGGGDLLDRISRKQASPSLIQRGADLAARGTNAVMGFERGLGKSAIETAENVGNLFGFGIPRALERPEEKAARERLTATQGRAEGIGKTTGDVATMLAPIPGLQEVRAPATAGRLARAGVTALREGAEIGAKSLATGASPKEAAESAAVAGPVGAITEVAVPGLSKVLDKWAQSQYGKVLHPLGRKAKEVAQENIPDILRQGRKAVAFTKEGLLNKWEDEVDRLGEDISQAYKTLDRTQRTRLGPIYDDLGQWIEKNAFTPGGAIKDPQILQAGLERMKYLEETLGPYIGTATPSEVWDVRKALDGYVYRNKLTADESVQAGKQVTRGLVNSVRNQLNKQHPSVADLNNPFHMWRSASELMSRNINNELGKLNFARNTGIIGRFLMGAAIGGGTEIAGRREADIWGTGTAAVLAGLAFESTGWRTVSAVTKAKIADLLVKGNGQAAAALAARATGVLRGQADRRLNRGEPTQ